MSELVTHWIGGRPVAGESGRRGPLFNPATGERIADVALADVETVDAALATAGRPEHWQA